MNLESIVKIYNDNKNLGLEYLLDEISRKFELGISRSAIYWFSKDIKNKCKSINEINYEYIDNKFCFFSNNEELFNLSLKKYDMYNTNESMLRTSMYPSFNENFNISISNEQFELGKHGLYENLSDDDYLKYRYISINSNKKVAYEAYIDKSQNKVEKHFYLDNGEITSKFYYNIERKDITHKDLINARERIFKFIDEEMPKIKESEIDYYVNELGDQFFYELELIKKVEDYNKIYIKNNSSFEVENREKDIFYGSLIKSKKGDSKEEYIVLSNPNFSNIKLLVISDFISKIRLSNGINKHILLNLKEWFENLDAKKLKDEEELVNTFKEKIDSLEYLLCKDAKNNKSNLEDISFGAALVGMDNTYVINYGNTRIYRVKDDNLEAITIDNTSVWDDYKKGIFSYEEASLYQKGSYITKKFGDKKNILNEREVIQISNNSYDKLFLFTDGITHNLKDKTLESIIFCNNDFDVLDEIINQASSKQIKQNDISGCCLIKK